MILLAAAAVAIAPPFAPPRAAPLDYVMLETRPTRLGEARITLHYRLSFMPTADAGTEVRLVMRDAEVAAPAALRPSMEALFAPFRNVPTRARIDDRGGVTGMIEAEATWAAVVASEKASIARTDADAAIPARSKAMIRALVAGAIFNLAPAERDRTLADTLATFLPPPLPALEPGEIRAFTTAVRGPFGSLPGSGTVRLESADGEALIYRIEARTGPRATAAAVAAMLATIPPDADAGQRAQIEATVARLKDTTYVERTILTLDRASGIVRRMRVERIEQRADGASSRISESDLSLDETE